jgi:ferrous iron transport protein A
MQLGGKKNGAQRTLADLRQGEEAVLESLDLPEELSFRLMELGFLPGTVVAGGHSAPGGDPKVFRVDGSEVALRRETSCCVRIRKS